MLTFKEKVYFAQFGDPVYKYVDPPLFFNRVRCPNLDIKTSIQLISHQVT